MRRSQPWRTNRARVLRAESTSAEDKMWAAMRARRLGGFKFVRQAPIEGDFVDFLCRELKIVVEIDGATHGSGSEMAYDQARTTRLEALGYRVFRAHNTDVYDDLDRVLDALLAVCEATAR